MNYDDDFEAEEEVVQKQQQQQYIEKQVVNYEDDEFEKEDDNDEQVSSPLNFVVPKLKIQNNTYTKSYDDEEFEEYEETMLDDADTNTVRNRQSPLHANHYENDYYKDDFEDPEDANDSELMENDSLSLQEELLEKQRTKDLIPTYKPKCILRSNSTAITSLNQGIEDQFSLQNGTEESLQQQEETKENRKQLSANELKRWRRLKHLIKLSIVTGETFSLPCYTPYQWFLKSKPQNKSVGHDFINKQEKKTQTMNGRSFSSDDDDNNNRTAKEEMQNTWTQAPAEENWFSHTGTESTIMSGLDTQQRKGDVSSNRINEANIYRIWEQKVKNLHKEDELESKRFKSYNKIVPDLCDLMSQIILEEQEAKENLNDINNESNNRVNEDNNNNNIIWKISETNFSTKVLKEENLFVSDFAKNKRKDLKFSKKNSKNLFFLETEIINSTDSIKLIRLQSEMQINSKRKNSNFELIRTFKLPEKQMKISSFLITKCERFLIAGTYNGAISIWLIGDINHTILTYNTKDTVFKPIWNSFNLAGPFFEKVIALEEEIDCEEEEEGIQQYYRYDEQGRYNQGYDTQKRKNGGIITGIDEDGNWAQLNISYEGSNQMKSIDVQVEYSGSLETLLMLSNRSNNNSNNKALGVPTDIISLKHLLFVSLSTGPILIIEKQNKQSLSSSTTPQHHRKKLTNLDLRPQSSQRPYLPSLAGDLKAVLLLIDPLLPHLTSPSIGAIKPSLQNLLQLTCPFTSNDACESIQLLPRAAMNRRGGDDYSMVEEEEYLKQQPLLDILATYKSGEIAKFSISRNNNNINNNNYVSDETNGNDNDNDDD